MRRRTSALLFASLLAACGGAGGAGSGVPVICITAAAPPMMVYPQNTAANVPDGSFTLVLTSQISPVELAAGTTVVYANLPPAAVPSPLPPGSATVTPAASLGGYALGPLNPRTAYNVIAPVPQSGCFPPNALPSPKPGIVGSFTTQ